MRHKRDILKTMNDMNTPKRGRGRPRLENARTLAILLKLNPDEIATVSKKAKRAGKPRAEWIRDTVLAA